MNLTEGAAQAPFALFDAVTLYAGRDEFKDAESLSGRLSRAGLKETTLDYAARRGIEPQIVVPRALQREAALDRQLRGSALERRSETPTAKRSMFDGLTLNRRRTGPDMSRLGDLPLSKSDLTPSAPKMPLEQAAERYARALDAAERMRAQSLPVLQHQKRELRDAARTLDGARPGATHDLHNALRHETATWRAMRDLRGAQRGIELAGAIRHEERVRRDPTLKADRLLKEWKRLETERDRLDGWRYGEARSRLEGRMKTIAGALKRDPQLESLVRSRAPALGVGPNSTLTRVLAAPTAQRATMEIGMGRDRGLSR